MSKYKVGDVAALFSEPKEPTTQAGKKLQAMFKEFHDRNKPFPSQETSSKGNNTSKIKNDENGDQRISKKNKKRKFSGTVDQELNDQNLKKFKTDESQELKFKNKEKKRESFCGERDILRKKKKAASKLNSSTSNSFIESEINGNFENEIKPGITPKFSNSPKAKKVKSGFIKKSKHQFHNSRESFDISHEKNSKIKSKTFDKGDESIKEEIQEFMKINSKKSKRRDSGKDTFENDHQQNSEEDNSFGMYKQEPKDNFKKNKNQVSNFNRKQKKKNKSLNNSFENADDKKSNISKSKHQIYDAGDNFDNRDDKNSKALDNNDETFKEKINEVIKTNSKKSKKWKSHKDNSEKDPQQNSEENDWFFGSKSTDKEDSKVGFKSNLKDKNQVSDFIRKPKKKNKTFNNSFKRDDKEESNISNQESFDTNDTLFKSENKDYVKNNTKKFKRDINNSIENSSWKSSSKSQPEFVKLLDKNTEDEDPLLDRTLFVGNLPINTRLNELNDLFSPFGDISYIRFKGIETDKAKIFGENSHKLLNAMYAADSVPGFIVYKERESAVNALALCGTVFKNRHITVDFAIPAGTKKLYDGKRSIFIGNLPFGVNEESIWDAFSDCGTIQGVRVVRDKATGIGKGFGYVLFSTAESRKNALSLEDLRIEGRTIRIKAVDGNNKRQKESDATTAKRDTFKSRAIRFKKTHKNANPNSRKSIKKIMNKEKAIHKKKKIASLLQKSMK